MKTARVISEAALDEQRGYAQKVAAYWETREISPAVYIDTYGCQQNEADSEQMRGLLREMGYTAQDTPEGADLVLVNTCAVREHAEQRVYGNIGALTHTRRRHPGQKIFLTGCMAGEEKVQQRLKKSYPYVDAVFTSHALWRLPEILWNALTGTQRQFVVPAEGVIAEGLPVVRQKNIKGWLSIMYGCNNFCTYCIVPYVRGRERSRSPENIRREAEGMIAAGYKDITLLGQNVNSYRPEGSDMTFPALLQSLSEIPGDYLLRFMTSHPKDASDDLFHVMASSPHIAKSIHLPFQSGSTRILRKMNRTYTREQYLGRVAAARAAMPEIVLTSDVIVGFPGETEEDFADTLSLVEQVRYHALFTFLFSPRSGTPAAKMEDLVPPEEKQRRFDALVQLQNEISHEKHAAYVGREYRVLVDGKDGDKLTARTEGGRLVRFAGPDTILGTFQTVKITAATTWSLSGELTGDVYAGEGGSTWRK